MKDTRLIMGLPITVEIVDTVSPEILEAVFSYFVSVDERFSPYKPESEVSRMPEALSQDMKEVLELAEKTKEETNGYFDIRKPDGSIDPSGIVKGWAIKNAADLLQEKGVQNFFIDAGGDIQTGGTNAEGKEWSVGIRNPFNKAEIIKVIYPRGRGVATSGSYERGDHIYNPLTPDKALDEIVSITVIGPDVLEADRFATAAFAMGQKGVEFIESLAGFEAYSIDKNGIATMTSNFGELTHI
ncbi:thiamine biosynthesis protein [Candidatus Adlerbacteria bacterium RIFOXYC1_FULL_48_26]|uniref:FAD:protein FMN transferase n=1 Tax=Candidatus Adlerbacteria bacterium RIFOXYC1_FULL_48_26 TaxID=1797247 RepID=A0A1F4Y5A4_9BACT|nr:MAG: thiamine biosynthesis protein [Candidatus Adlerbacteria bacterium RIFOXYC1_FULL_48_26]OGC93847.1 MAG: thiamine biosynthesis protein [Candidatus Adlerbacteria bacterium RIFOXYB1_FULL_48_10]